MPIFDRLLAFFGLRRTSYVMAAVAEAAKNGYIEGHGVGAVLGHQGGYQIGMAHGQIQGRIALAEELQVAHGVGEGGEKNMGLAELSNLKIRQLH